MVAIDLTGQTPLDDIEERVERREVLVLWVGHAWFPMLSTGMKQPAILEHKSLQNPYSFECRRVLQ
jgi:hypothetical protein